MEVKGWKGEMLGVRIGATNRDKYFSRDWDSVCIELEGKTHSIVPSPGFWKNCPELRSAEIQEWLIRRGLAPWPHGLPPKLELVPLGGQLFRLSTPKQL